MNRRTPSAPTALTTSGARRAAFLCMAAMKGVVQESSRSASSLRAAGRPVRTTSVSEDHVAHSERLCFKAVLASSLPPAARKRAAAGALA